VLKRIIDGRIGRLQFALLALVPIPIFIEHPFFNQGDFLFFFAWFPYVFLLGVKRFHDFGVSMMSQEAVKYANFKSLFFLKGDPYENKYGKPPKF
tara:strand:- start:540 stop:824 length:285 start_codon:yes stop_codon:yes gene_type:complete